VCCVQLQQLCSVKRMVCKKEIFDMLLIRQERKPRLCSLPQQPKGLGPWCIPCPCCCCFCWLLLCHVPVARTSSSSRCCSGRIGRARFYLDAAHDSSNTVAAP
jgi:hypothetical protein